MKCRRWISANSQEIISERAAFHYWKSGKSKEIKQMVYYSKISEEVGVVLCRRVTGNMRPQQGFLPASTEAFAQHRAGGADAGVRRSWWYPGLKRLRVLHWCWVWLLGSLEPAQHSAFPDSCCHGCHSKGAWRALCPILWAILEINPWAEWTGTGNYETSGVKAGLTGSRGMGSGRGTAQGQKRTRKLFLL